MKFRDSVFVVTEEYSCPLYKVGDEFIMRDSALTVECGKEFCMILMKDMLKMLAEPKPIKMVNPMAMRRTKFECGGCTGLIRFEHKKYRTTIQCRLLPPRTIQKQAKQQTVLVEAHEQREKQRIAGETVNFLRDIEVFEALNDFDLQELSLMMELKCYPANEVILKEGDLGAPFYIILNGKVVAVKSDGEVIAKLERGNIFGEISLLTGEPVYPSFYSLTAVQLACLNAENFRRIV
ncbi:MAG: cyclic nucleotide-binding domain-containing protein, partial [Candidatus Electrothrix sp. AUS1_2]|nr:cyclic nucleotide-binding domain-containing protein [Candidatus Electrothrix sp. AUS1_2]